MISLPNNCKCSGKGPVVNPSNWKTIKASLKKEWYISYRFYDPAFTDHPRFKKGKLVIVKGMNEYQTLSERQDFTQSLLDEILLNLHKREYNPITGNIRKDAHDVTSSPAGDEITPQTPLIAALYMVLAKITVEKTTADDIASVLKYFALSAEKLNKESVPVGEIKRKDLRLILDNCRLIKKVWNDNQFNHYRKYISLLYAELEELEVVEYNPVEKIAKKETTEKVREVLTAEERIRINEHLKERFPAFHRFMHIFFHSGARRNELFSLQGKNVDLAGQRYKVTIKKGRKRREVWKTIKDIALPYWIEIMQNCRDADYVFSSGLNPGPLPINPKQVTRRWNTHVIKGLGIKKGFYKLKHLHTTETVDLVEQQMQAARVAAEHNSHTTEAMVVSIYDVKQGERKHNAVKGAKNKFA